MAFLISPAALAQSEVEGEEAFQAGVRAFDAGDYELAVSRFRRSLSLYPRAKTACNLALSYERLGNQQVDARDAYRRCIELDDTGRFSGHAQERQVALSAEIDELGLEPMGTPDSESEAVHREPVEGGVNEGVEGVDESVENGSGSEDRQLVPRASLAFSPPRGYVVRGVGITLAALGAVALIGGVATYLVYQDSTTDDQTYERAQRWQRGLYIGGAIALGTGLTMIIIDTVLRRQDERSGYGFVVPTLDGGMVAGGGFAF